MMFDDSFWLWILEQEGELDTHDSKIHAFAKQLAIVANPWDEEVQNSLLAACGLSRDELCPRDIYIIQRESGVEV